MRIENAKYAKDWLFQSLISGMDKSMQTTLNMMYHNSMMIDEMNHRREMEQMKEEIVQEVLSHISARWMSQKSLTLSTG